MKNFLITGMGRSGTKFLATVMSQSKQWAVKHEPWGTRDKREPPRQIQKRFNRDYYGEVNSNLLNVADKIRVADYGVIIRDPINVWLSMVNKHHESRRGEDFRTLERGMKRASLLAMEVDFFPISFELMVTNPAYLQAVLYYFGIDDVKITEEMLKVRINATVKPKYTSLAQFDEKTQRMVTEARRLWLSLCEPRYKRGIVS